MSYQDFYNDFKKEITGDYLFLYGAEDFLMEWAVNQIIERYVDESARNLDVQYLDGDNCSAADIMGAARAFSMFSDKRVIVVRNFLPIYRKNTDVDGDALCELCTGKLGQAVLVFVLESKYAGDITAYGKKLMKACSAYEFARLDKAALQPFINKRVHAAGKMLGRREMDYLIDLSGYYNKESEYNLSLLDSDLAKITNACEGDSITINLIEELLVGKEDKYVFNLVDAMMSGNKGAAMSLAETIIREDDGSMAVLALLTKQLEIMYDALELEKEGYSIAQMAKATGVNEFRLKKAYQAARSYSTSKLREMLIKAYNIDRDIKTGELDKDVAFELLVVGL